MKSMNNNTPAESVDTTATPDTPDAQQPSQSPATPEAPAAAPAPAATPAPATGQSARSLLKQLQQEYPAFRDCLPLSIGIDKQLQERMPGLDKKTMRAALGIHTGSMRYLRAMEKAKVRYDLDGTAGAEVPEAHRLHAKEQLQQRFKKEADRKKAERDAALEEENNRKRQEKLQALASKFSKN